MRTTWQALAWKEWHEHKWKLAAVTTVLCGLAAVITLDSINHDSRASELMEIVFAFTSIYAIVPLAIFLGASDAAEERGRGIQPFTQSLPVPMWQVASWKLSVGLAACVLPIVVMVAMTGVACAWFIRQPEQTFESIQRHREQIPLLFQSAGSLTNQLVSAGLLATMVGTSVYLWTAAVGMNRRNEVEAGAMAILATVVWWMIVILSSGAIESAWLKTSSAAVVLGVSPGGVAVAAIMSAHEVPYLFLPTLIVAIVFHAALAACFIARYGRSTQNDAYSPKAVATGVPTLGWIGPPRRGPLTAIIWKQFRESTPIVLAGIAGIFGFFTANLLTYPDFYTADRRHMGELMVELDSVIGFLVALAVGIGVFDRDLGPKLNAFWRSRPINPDLWFWTKFVTGLGVLLTATSLPVFIGWLASIAPRPDSGIEIRMVYYLQVTVFVAALAAICFVRQSVFAAILGGGTLAIALSAVHYFWDADKHDVETTTLICATAIIVFGILAAWLSVRCDWGRKN